MATAASSEGSVGVGAQQLQTRAPTPLTRNLTMHTLGTPIMPAGSSSMSLYLKQGIASIGSSLTDGLTQIQPSTTNWGLSYFAVTHVPPQSFLQKSHPRPVVAAAPIRPSRQGGTVVHTWHYAHESLFQKKDGNKKKNAATKDTGSAGIIRQHRKVPNYAAYRR